MPCRWGAQVKAPHLAHRCRASFAIRPSWAWALCLRVRMRRCIVSRTSAEYRSTYIRTVVCVPKVCASDIMIRGFLWPLLGDRRCAFGQKRSASSSPFSLNTGSTPPPGPRLAWGYSELMQTSSSRRLPLHWIGIRRQRAVCLKQVAIRRRGAGRGVGCASRITKTRAGFDSVGSQCQRSAPALVRLICLCVQ